MRGLDRLNALEEKQALAEILRCCASSHWAQDLVKKRPFSSQEILFEQADQIWFSLEKPDWLEAFAGHPKIGDLDSLKKKYANTQTWTQDEQSGMSAVSETILQELKNRNAEYEEKFGYIFIVCATGKGAEEMLDLLKTRLNNSPEEELKIAALEQSKITKIRLEKLL